MDLEHVNWFNRKRMIADLLRLSAARNGIPISRMYLEWFPGTTLLAMFDLERSLRNQDERDTCNGMKRCLSRRFRFLVGSYRYSLPIEWQA